MTKEPTKYFLSEIDYLRKVICKLDKGAYTCTFPMTRTNENYNKMGNVMSGLSKIECKEMDFVAKSDRIEISSPMDTVCSRDGSELVCAYGEFPDIDDDE